MALNFPNSPTLNQEVELGGKTYRWDGVKWRMVYVVTPTAQSLAPTITEVSVTGTSITFTITNNDTDSAVILYEVGDNTPDENSIELAASATSSNITISGLTGSTQYTVSATASVTGKVLSNVAQQNITTAVPIFYTAATGGTTLEYDLGGKRYRSHTFTSSGTFTVTTVGDAIDDRNKVDYLIIAGGGSGGNAGRSGGGGGAGGYRTTLGTSGGNSTAETKITVTNQGYSVVIGAGGASVGSNNADGIPGSNSSVFGIVSTGGGLGLGDSSISRNGGSGGGGNDNNGISHSGGSGIAGQGTNGGAGRHALPNGQGGGGGGASQAGANGISTTGGKGGDGLANLLRTGSNETRAGGGGGSSNNVTGGAGGAGGGGAGRGPGVGNGISGTINTGSGGGGAIEGITGAGGSGIVVIRYEIAPSV